MSTLPTPDRTVQSTHAEPIKAPMRAMAGDNFILCSRGLVRLRTLGDPNGATEQPLDVQLGSGSTDSATKHFLVHGSRPTLRLRTSRGYTLQGTMEQAIRVVDAGGNWCWKQLPAVCANDWVPLRMGGMIGEANPVLLPPLPDAYWTSDYAAFVPRYVTADLAEFVGYFMGDGSLHSRSIRLCAANTDPDVVDRLTHLGRSLFGLEAHASARKGYTEVCFNSIRLVLWWEACGFTKTLPDAGHQGKGYTPQIPDALLHTNDPTIYAAFVRGLFEADGTQQNQFVSFSTSSSSFCDDVQALLLALGFITTKKIERAGAGRWGSKSSNILRLLNVNCTARFLRAIGFVSERKQVLKEDDHPQAARFDHVPLPRKLIDELAPVNDNLRKTLLMALARHGSITRRSAQELFSRNPHKQIAHYLGFFYDRLATAEHCSEQPVFAVTGPDFSTHIASGFLCEL